MIRFMRNPFSQWPRRHVFDRWDGGEEALASLLNKQPKGKKQSTPMSTLKLKNQHVGSPIANTQLR